MGAVGLSYCALSVKDHTTLFLNIYKTYIKLLLPASPLVSLAGAAAL